MSNPSENSPDPAQPQGTEKDSSPSERKIIRSTKAGMQPSHLHSRRERDASENIHPSLQAATPVPSAVQEETPKSFPTQTPKEEEPQDSVPVSTPPYIPLKEQVLETNVTTPPPEVLSHTTQPKPPEDHAVYTAFTSSADRKEREEVLQDAYSFNPGMPISNVYAEETSYPESPVTPLPPATRRTLRSKFEAIYDSPIILVTLIVLNIMVISILIAQLFIGWGTYGWGFIDKIGFWKYGLGLLGAFLVVMVVELIRRRLLATSSRDTGQEVASSNTTHPIDSPHEADRPLSAMASNQVPDMFPPPHVPPEMALPTHDPKGKTTGLSSMSSLSSVEDAEQNAQVVEQELQQSPPREELSLKAVEWEDVMDRPLEDDSDLPNHPHIKVFPDAVRREQNKIRNGWQVIGASRRGLGHIYDGKYREDDFSIQTVGEDIILVAIADGVGSKRLSRHGALAAVEGATRLPDDELKKLAERIRKHDADKSPSKEINWIAQNLLIKALQQGARSVQEQAKRDGASIRDLHSTLLIFLAVPYKKNDLYVASTQVGDGALYALQPGKGEEPYQRWLYLQAPQVQDVENEVIPFMSTNQTTWEGNFRSILLRNPGPTFLMSMTDGVANDIALSPGADIDEFTDVERFYQGVSADVLSKKEPSQAANALAKFLDYRIRGSFDDRTLVCLYRKQ